MLWYNFQAFLQSSSYDGAKIRKKIENITIFIKKICLMHSIRFTADLTSSHLLTLGDDQVAHSLSFLRHFDSKPDGHENTCFILKLQ